MKIVVLATDEQWNELAVETAGVEWECAVTPFSFNNYTDAAGFFILNDIDTVAFSATEKPVFIHSVVNTLQQAGTPKNVFRINGWHGFLQRPLWEIAGEISTAATTVLQKINKQFVNTTDEPGFIADKTIAMIINEAYFALGNEVSSKNEIDTAMKLGTNYPFGPFEWAAKIGLKNIYELLQQLEKTDKRYTPAPALMQEAIQP